MNAYETRARYNLAETCVSSLTIKELLDISGERDKILNDMLELRLTYVHIEGSPGLLAGICSLYETMKPENVTTAHGAIGMNALVFSALVEPGDEVVSILPAYQQLYSMPEALGAKVTTLPLNMDNAFTPGIDALAQCMNERVKLVVLNNPHNPSGAVMERDYLSRIVDIVRLYGAYILCDEAYRGLTHAGQNFTPSMADLYEKGISTASMSKGFSLAGLRLGWAAAPRHVIELINKHRDYNTISCGVIDDYLAALAIKHHEKIFRRNLGIVRSNLEILDKWIAGDKNFSYIKPQGGTTAFVKLNFDMPSMEFCLKLLDNTGVMIVPGSVMDAEGFVRIGYAFEPELLQTGLDIISEFTRGCLEA